MVDLKERFQTLDRLEAPDLWPETERRRPGTRRSEPQGRRLLAAAVALAAAAAAMALTTRAFLGTETRKPATTSSPIASRANGPIWFLVSGEGAAPGAGLWRIAPDGTGERKVFDPGPVCCWQLAWSPDGRRMAYVDRRAGHFGIYTANADGSGAVQLTDGVNDGWPSWSPDGTRFAFSSTRADPDARGCQVGGDFECATDIYVMGADGSNVTRLTADPVPEYHPVWSPDGRRIAFVRTFNGSATAIYVMNADGTKITQASGAAGGSDFSPSWSPVSEQIVFASIRFEDWGIFVVNPDGTGERQLLNEGGYVNDPVWSPDGSLIAFVGSGFDGFSEEHALYVMRPDGSGITRVTSEALDPLGVTGQIAWQPVPVQESSPMPSVTPPPVGAQVTDVIDLDGPGSAVAYGEGNVWVAVSNNDGTFAGHVLRLDPRTGDTIADIPVDAVPGWEVGGGGLTVGDGSVWIAGTVQTPGSPDRRDWNNALLIRIDVANSQVMDEIDLGGLNGADVAVDPNGVWVLIFAEEDRMEVVRVDPATDEIVARIPIDSAYGHFVFARGGNVVVPASGARAGRGDLATDGTVLYTIDPNSDGVVGSLPLGNSAWPAMGEDGLVRLVTVDRLLTIDPADLKVVDDVPLRATGDALAVGNGGVWFLDPEDRAAVHRLNMTTNEVDVSVGLPKEASTPIALALSLDAVWVLDYEHKLVRVALS